MPQASPALPYANRQVALRYVPPASLTAYAGNARTHSRAQIKQIAHRIARFRSDVPVLITEEGEIIAGDGRVLAALELNLAEVPVLPISHLTEAERRA